jgi:hypothetical protein
MYRATTCSTTKNTKLKYLLMKRKILRTCRNLENYKTLSGLIDPYRISTILKAKPT